MVDPAPIPSARATAAPRVGLATAAGMWVDDVDAAATVTALGRAGCEAMPLVWDDPSVDWAAWDLVVVRSTWDYARRREAFLAWADEVAAATHLANPPAVLRWNSDKHYLDDLAGAGVPVVPTAFVDAGDQHPDEELDEVLAASLGSGGELVVKPAVSAGALDTLRHHRSELDAARDQARSLLEAGRDVMVQPYLDGVDSSGETGLVFFDGELSHAFGKDPLLRRGAGAVVGPYAEETISPRVPEPAELDVARLALGATAALLGRGAARGEPSAEGPLYARVDLVPGPDGGPVLLELELCEPSFFLHTDPAAADRFARAVRRRLGT